MVHLIKVNMNNSIKYQQYGKHEILPYFFLGFTLEQCLFLVDIE